MEVKKVFKRLFAIGAGVTMLGATVMGAMAANLNNYPNMFVKDGVYNGLLVVGENAASVDNIAITDIAGGMMYLKAGTASSVSVEGDAWKVGTSAKYLEIANNNATSSSSQDGETIRSIVSFIGNDELAALGDGTWSTNENEYGFQQFLFFDDATLTSEVVKYVENDDDVTADHFYVKNGQPIARYKLEFTSTAQSDVTDAVGTAATTGVYLDDFEDTTLSLFGKEYTVVQARRTATTGGGVKLVLMVGATSDTLLEGESKTYSVGDKTFDVTLSYVDSTYAKFIVNGESTNKISDGSTYVLKDKTEIGVSDVLYQGYAGGIHSASFFLGAQKVELQDAGVAAGGSSYELKVGSETIDGADVIITGTDDNTTFSISTIELNMTAQDDYFVGSGEKLSDVILAAGDEKELLFGNAFDVEYNGLSTEDTHDIILKKSSSKRYELHVFDGDNKAVDLPLAYADAQYNLSLGKETDAGSDNNRKALVLREGTDIYKDDYFVLTSGTDSSGAAKSYLMQYMGVDKSSKTSPKIKFKNQGSGETLEYSATTQTATGTVATIKLGGYSFLVQNASVQSTDDYQVDIDLDGGGAIGTNIVTFVDSYGPTFTFNWSVSSPANSSNQDYVQITQSTTNVNDYDDQAPSNLIMNITGTTSDPEVRSTFSGLTLLTPSGETEVTYGYTSMGTFVKLAAPSSDPQELTLTYPKKQLLPQLYFTSGATTSTTTTGGTLTSVMTVGATKLDSEVSSMEAQNLIVVGGPCVNTVAAELLGNPADCTEGFSPGKARIKLFEHANGNIAMLVAGYSGADTRLAGSVIANRYGDLSGTEVEVEGTTFTDATIGAPSATPVVEEVVEEEVVEETTE
ncbi:MAG: hypothetical protein ABH824_01435 [Nanoarchaeota archaeon]|nr:hypothetical protein [Nanoarchaeota archaeon]